MDAKKPRGGGLVRLEYSGCQTRRLLSETHRKFTRGEAGLQALPSTGRICRWIPPAESAAGATGRICRWTRNKTPNSIASLVDGSDFSSPEATKVTESAQKPSTRHRHNPAADSAGHEPVIVKPKGLTVEPVRAHDAFRQSFSR